MHDCDPIHGFQCYQEHAGFRVPPGSSELTCSPTHGPCCVGMQNSTQFHSVKMCLHVLPLSDIIKFGHAGLHVSKTVLARSLTYQPHYMGMQGSDELQENVQENVLACRALIKLIQRKCARMEPDSPAQLCGHAELHDFIP